MPKANPKHNYRKTSYSSTVRTHRHIGMSKQHILMISIAAVVVIGMVAVTIFVLDSNDDTAKTAQVGDTLEMYYELWVLDESTETLDKLQSGPFTANFEATADDSNLIYGFWEKLDGLEEGKRIDFWLDACIDDGQLLSGDTGSIHPDSVEGDGWDDRYAPGEVRAESYGVTKPTTSQTTGKSYDLRNTNIRFVIEITNIER